MVEGTCLQNLAAEPTRRQNVVRNNALQRDAHAARAAEAICMIKGLHQPGRVEHLRAKLLHASQVLYILTALGGPILNKWLGTEHVALLAVGVSLLALIINHCQLQHFVEQSNGLLSHGDELADLMTISLTILESLRHELVL